MVVVFIAIALATLACAYMIGAALLGQHASQGRMTPKDRETDNLENREQMRIW